MRTSATRVLIIDDDPLIRTLLVSALRKECFVAVAAEGSEGFAKALELKPDVAVIDINMPGWDGLQTLGAFRGDASLRDVKIIMLTADASQQTVMAAVRGGANDYLIKTSFSKADFYRKLNQLVPGTIRDAAPSSGACSSQVASVANGAPRSEAEPKHAPRVEQAAHSATDDTPPLCSSDAAVDSQLQVMIDGWE